MNEHADYFNVSNSVGTISLNRFLKLHGFHQYLYFKKRVMSQDITANLDQGRIHKLSPSYETLRYLQGIPRHSIDTFNHTHTPSSNILMMQDKENAVQTC